MSGQPLVTQWLAYFFTHIHQGYFSASASASASETTLKDMCEYITQTSKKQI